MKRNSNTNSSSESLALDDASTLESASGGSPLVHGLAIDTFARSVPTTMVPLHVRDALFRAWPGMNGPAVALTRTTNHTVGGASNPLIPWYSYTPSVASTASLLTVSVAAAEEWVRDNTGLFASYADLPMNAAAIERWAFWRYDPEANELDEAMMLEPQVYAHDQLSQLFTESCTFHFGFLMDVDSEYHRLRKGGVVGQFNAAAIEYEPWYRLYHYWRHQVELAYLDGANSNANPLVRLPQHLLNGNWTIANVMEELLDKLEGQKGFIHNDMIVTAKGFQRGKSSITLGLQGDTAYQDGDGNSRFYLPLMQSPGAYTASFRAPGTIIHADNAYYPEIERRMLLDGDSGVRRAGSSPSVTTTALRDQLSVGEWWSVYDWLLTNGAVVSPAAPWKAVFNAHRATYGGNALGFTFTEGRVWSGFDQIVDLPYSGTLDVAEDGGTTSYNYWSGHCLNLFQFIEFMKYVGQATEPEVLDKLILPFGIVTGIDHFQGSPSGATAMHLDNLYNLYESQSSFNENPSRKYTAAHLGPSDHMLPNDATAPGALVLRGNVLNTEQGGVQLTARERYWTPGSLSNSDAAATSSAFFPGVVCNTTLFPNINVELLASYDDSGLREFLSRSLTTTGSMRTKVEKQVFLPAGKTGPEGTFASGVGVGALQLVYEIFHVLCGGRPRFGLGYGGFSDIAANPGSGTSWDIISRGSVQPANTGILVSNYGNLSQLTDSLSLLRKPGASDILSYIDAASTSSTDVSEHYKSCISFSLINDTSRSAATSWWKVTSNTVATPGDGISDHSGIHPMSDTQCRSITGDVTAAGLLAAGDAGDARRDRISSTNFVSTAMKGAGFSSNINVQALPRALSWGVPHFATANNPNTPATGQININRNTPVADKGFDTALRTAPADASVFARPHMDIVMLANTITLRDSTGAQISAVSLADGSSTPVHAFNRVLVDGNAGPLTRHHSIDSATVALPYTASLQCNGAGANASYVATSAPYCYTNGSYGASQWEPFQFNNVGSGGTFTQDSFRWVTPLFTPAQVIRSYGIDMYMQAVDAGATSESLTEVTFDITVSIELVDANTADTAAQISGSGGNGVTILGDSIQSFQFQGAVAEQGIHLNSLGLSAVGLFTPSIGGIHREVAFTPTIPWEEGTHVMSIGSTWNPAASLTAYAGTLAAGETLGWLQNISAWQIPGKDVAVDYGIWQVWSAPDDHPVARMAGVWQDLDLVHDLISCSDNGFENGPPTSLFPIRAGGGYFDPSGHAGQGNSVTSMSDVVYGELFQHSTSNSAWIAGIKGHDTLFGAAESNEETDGIGINAGLTTYTVSSSHVMNVPALLSGLTAAGGSCATYVYPDLPQYKMQFRPFRRIADATVMMEQRLTFMNDREDTSHLAGPLGISVIGTPKPFRFADLVDAGTPETFLLEPLKSRTRLIDPSHRSVLTFTKLALLDPDSQAHTIPGVIQEENQKQIGRGLVYASAIGGSSKVYTRALIRDIQLGRQFQRLN